MIRKFPWPYICLIVVLSSCNVLKEVGFGDGSIDDNFFSDFDNDSIDCPTGYIAVTGSSDYNTDDFCVMQFEAKNDSGNAASTAVNTPWVNINRDNAISACQALGAGYDLISNVQWQTLARDIELVDDNWAGGSVGVTGINQGHSDNTPSSALSVSNENDPYDQTGNSSGQAYQSGKEQKRTWTLSNGNIIWDLGGNVIEWVKDDNATIYDAQAYFSQITTGTHTTTGVLNDGVSRAAKEQFGPFGNYTSFNSGNYAGLGYGALNANAGAVGRGGMVSGATQTGIFYVMLSQTPTFSHTLFGFRCVYLP